MTFSSIQKFNNHTNKNIEEEYSIKLIKKSVVSISNIASRTNNVITFCVVEITVEPDAENPHSAASFATVIDHEILFASVNLEINSRTTPAKIIGNSGVIIGINASEFLMFAKLSMCSNVKNNTPKYTVHYPYLIILGNIIMIFSY
jgi:hypothetical protein